MEQPLRPTDSVNRVLEQGVQRAPILRDADVAHLVENVDFADARPDRGDGLDRVGLICIRTAGQGQAGKERTLEVEGEGGSDEVFDLRPRGRLELPEQSSATVRRKHRQVLHGCRRAVSERSASDTRASPLLMSPASSESDAYSVAAPGCPCSAFPAR